jgi:glycosyltransferase involved in cell wall biosynthesis
MKILNAIHAQNIGGVDQVFRNYSEILTQNGHEVALLISKNGNENYQAKKIFRLRNKSQILDVFYLIYILYSFRPDVVICHSPRPMKWMGILRFFTKAKSVAVNHGVGFKHSTNCDFVISVNQQISDMVTKTGFAEAKTFVVPNAVGIDRSFVEKHPKNPLKIGIYGRIETCKGFDILLRAAGILQKNDFDFRLKIGGFEVPGNYGWKNVKDSAKDENILEKCEFVGTVLDKEKFFSDVDILCVPSRHESFGMVILEGFLFSTLVISSDTDGGKFLIKDGENGILFSNENPENLAAKIIEISKDLTAYNKLTKQAFLRLEKDFSFTSLRQQFETILKKICA